MSDNGLFTVWVMKADGAETCVMNSVTAEVAMAHGLNFIHSNTSKQVLRIRIKDSNGTISFEWVHDKGITFPLGFTSPEELFTPSSDIKSACIASFEYNRAHAIIEFDLDEVDSVLDYMDKRMEGTSYINALMMFMGLLEDGVKEGPTDERAQNIIDLGIWTIFRYDPGPINPPKKTIREVANTLLENGITPYICWHVGERGLAMLCSDRYVNISQALPEGTPEGYHVVNIGNNNTPPTIH